MKEEAKIQRDNEKDFSRTGKKKKNQPSKSGSPGNTKKDYKILKTPGRKDIIYSKTTVRLMADLNAETLG